MSDKYSINQVALAALIVAVVAIATVSAVSITALKNLIGVNTEVLRMQRLISSVESIRFHAMAIDSSEQSYVITGSASDLGVYRSARVEMFGELEFLEQRKAELPALAERYLSLQKSIDALIVAEKRIVDAREKKGFEAARLLVIEGRDEKAQRQVIANADFILLEARRNMDSLEMRQSQFADRVQRWIIALISSAALVLIFCHGVVRKLSLDQIAAREKIAYQAMHDSLTGLANRDAIIEHLDARLANGETERALGGFALMLLDLDGFKAVNDELGHDAGDELLKIVAKRLVATLRDSDFIARLGGDEFLVVVPQVSDRDTAGLVADKLIRVLAEPYAINSKLARVSASIGVSLFPTNGSDREVLMKAADLAMYEAKRAGRNQARFFMENSA
jgi:diguanylate cyclase (GGDEF)-like protein